ncbi:PilZ domain-containing protein [Planctomyces sp. SH-PL62]|uniref:PilZ domain-containing protein n=1 Tax=Planctomyces sp. SH-PL62 TaxID=1636152 RepID=UPI00078B9BC0|nr:PilZ domain-containing protein [Planctomyces sp. SH-PL62]AMV39508.1 PilZ domain protein [Planctomyces sp. SH-PL62]
MLNLDKSTQRRLISGPSRGRGPHISLDRRASPRMPAVDCRIWLGWWASETQFATVASRVVDLSRGGARLTSPTPLEEFEEVWLKTAKPEASDCVRAEVLEVSETPEGDHVIRLRFHEECPDDFFDAVTRG